MIILEKVDCKIWLTGRLEIRDPVFPKILLSKLYRSDAKKISLHSEINYLNHAIILASAAVELSLASTMLEENGQRILVENFIENFPNLKKLCIFWNEENIPPCKNYEKILTYLEKLPDFQKFIFEAVPDNFNIETFLKCVKHLKIQFETELFYLDASMPEINNRLEVNIDEIMKTEFIDYCPTHIWSHYLEKVKPQKYFPLWEKYRKYLKNKV
uniref:Uncharacterized protein n=1 Tax=Panagrolaimus sp. ES5 TaxID=591445 RepID=A0AC34GQK9_9BILA